MAEIVWHRRETRRQTENTNVMPGALEGLILLDNYSNAPFRQQLYTIPCAFLVLHSTMPCLIFTVSMRGTRRGGNSRMDWKTLLAYITGSVDQALLLRNEYLVTENRMLRNQITGRVRLTDGERKTLAEIGHKLGKQALTEVATIVK